MSVSLDFIMQGPFGGLIGELRAFDAMGMEIDAAFTPADQEGVTTLTVSSLFPNISRITATYGSNGNADGGGLDNLVVVVPEPSATILLGAGALGCLLFGRRRLLVRRKR